MSRPVRVRFAPSPTGLLHIGVAHTALFNWLFARKEHGSFLLRIEDTDTERSRQEWVEVIFDGLRWLGMDWGEEIVYQSHRVDRHRSQADALVEAGKAYRCYYLPEELEAKRQEALAEGRSWRNDRRYAEISDSEAEALEAAGRRPVIRLKIPEGKTVFQDRILGEIAVDNETVDDFVIVRSNGTPLYHLAVVVDDADMNISHVIRGIDHVTNTPKHIQLFRALGAEVPEFAHLPSILGEDKKKLSKRHGAVSVTEYRDAGYLSDAVVNFLSLLGWQTGDDQEFFTRAEIMERFSLDQVHKRDTVFDLRKFEWLNGQHIMARSSEELWTLAKPYLSREGLIADGNGRAGDHNYAMEVVGLLRERCRTLADFAVQGRFFFTDDFEYNPKAVRKHWSKEPEAVSERLGWLRAEFEALDELDVEAAEGVIRGLSERHGLKAAQFIHPCRVALTGEMAGPSLFHVVAALGRETCVDRLQKARERLPDTIEQAAVDQG
ncbi:MAG: glutamate--tRNA ligase [Gemmatimonadetes bacterium]|nr:glutamate--tRNA ligase [Gemmatimonadota bacterium]